MIVPIVVGAGFVVPIAEAVIGGSIEAGPLSPSIVASMGGIDLMAANIATNLIGGGGTSGGGTGSLFGA